MACSFTQTDQLTGSESHPGQRYAILTAPWAGPRREDHGKRKGGCVKVKTLTFYMNWRLNILLPAVCVNRGTMVLTYSHISKTTVVTQISGGIGLLWRKIVHCYWSVPPRAFAHASSTWSINCRFKRLNVPPWHVYTYIYIYTHIHNMII